MSALTVPLPSVKFFSPHHNIWPVTIFKLVLTPSSPPVKGLPCLVLPWVFSDSHCVQHQTTFQRQHLGNLFSSERSTPPSYFFPSRKTISVFPPLVRTASCSPAPGFLGLLEVQKPQTKKTPSALASSSLPICFTLCFTNPTFRLINSIPMHWIYITIIASI